MTALVSRVEGGASQVAVLTWDGLSSQGEALAWEQRRNRHSCQGH